MTRNKFISIAILGLAIAGLTVHAAERTAENAFASKTTFSSIASALLPATNKSFGGNVNALQRDHSSLPQATWCIGEDAIYRDCPEGADRAD
jgi:hypothetical protein